MSKKTRNYFITGPTGSTGTKFKKGNLPNEEEFSNWRDSIPFFLEPADEAGLEQRGLIKRASDDNCLNPSEWGVNTRVGDAKAVSPRQLPLVVCHSRILNVEPITPSDGDIVQDQVTQGNGIKIVKAHEYSANSQKRRVYDVSFDPESLDVTETENKASLWLIVAEKDTLVPKKMSAGLFATYFTMNDAGQLDANDVKMVNVKGLNLSSAEIKSADTSVAALEVKGVDKTGKGQSVKLSAGKSTNNDAGGDVELIAAQSDYSTKGGDVLLTAGRSLGANGGDVSLEPGQGFVSDGVVKLNSVRGKTEIGHTDGSADPTSVPTTFSVTMKGNQEIKGSLKVVSLFASKGIMIGDSNVGLAGMIRVNTGSLQFYKASKGWTNVALAGDAGDVTIDDADTTSTNVAWSASKLVSELSGKSNTGHNHDTAYLGLYAKAADSSLLNGHPDTYFASQTDLAAVASSAALGIKYSWADTAARDAQTGHAVGEMGIIESVANRPVYRANSVAAGAGSWDLAFYMDATHTHAYSTLTGLPSLPVNLIDLGETSASRHLTDTKIALWDGKANAADVYTKTAADALLATKAVVNDSVTNSTNVWSSSKISTELTGKSATSHTHDADDVAETSVKKWLTPTMIATWDAKSDFDGDYGSLTSAPFVASTGGVTFRNTPGKKVLVKASSSISDTAKSGLDIDDNIGFGGVSLSSNSSFTFGSSIMQYVSGNGTGKAYLPAADDNVRRFYIVSNIGTGGLVIGRQLGESINGLEVDVTIAVGEAAIIHSFGSGNWYLLKINA
jgi:hypothetical protein